MPARVPTSPNGFSSSVQDAVQVAEAVAVAVQVQPIRALLLLSQLPAFPSNFPAPQAVAQFPATCTCLPFHDPTQPLLQPPLLTSAHCT